MSSVLQWLPIPLRSLQQTTTFKFLSCYPEQDWKHAEILRNCSSLAVGDHDLRYGWNSPDNLSAEITDHRRMSRLLGIYEVQNRRSLQACTHPYIHWMHTGNGVIVPPLPDAHMVSQII